MTDPLAERRAVVTGSSTGIGKAIALELAAAGASVVLHGRTESDELRETAAAIEQPGRSVEVATCDLSQRESLERFVEQVDISPVDIWINNAGVDVLTGDPADRSFAEKLEILWQVDVLASIELSRLIGQRMFARRRGVILNMGWDQAATGMEGDSGEMFAAVKGAVMAFTRSLAKSLAPHVRANCLAPGWIKTDWGTTASNEWQQRAVAESLLDRWGTPEDVAKMARFLASDDASFITGQIIDVNGGAGRRGR